MHPFAKQRAEQTLALADRLFPHRVRGFYVVGSAALGGFRPERSDIDFIAVLDEARDSDCRRVRALQVLSGARTTPWAIRRRLWAGPSTCNGVFLPEGELTKPVTAIDPIASYAGHSFSSGAAFDVNPVVWQVFASRGVALRGPEPSTLGLDPEPETLRQWNLDNLDGYWRRFGERAASGRSPNGPLAPARWTTAWGVLGAPRLHHTIATGAVISKEDAGAYALATFAQEWHPIISEGLAYWRDEPADPAFADRAHRLARTGAFVLHVVDAAHQL